MKDRCLYIKWVDSTSKYGWISPDRALAELNCETIGWVVQENEDSITLSGGRSFEHGTIDQVDSPITIPKCSIKKTRRIKL